MRTYLAATIVTMLMPITTIAEETDWKTGPLAHLSQHIGTYNYDTILNDPTVQQNLQSALGADNATLETYLQVRRPIGFSGTCLTLTGNAPRQGGDKMAMVIACPRDGRVEVAIASAGHVKIYTNSASYSHLDAVMRHWVTHYLARYENRVNQPANVDLISSE